MFFINFRGFEVFLHDVFRVSSVETKKAWERIWGTNLREDKRKKEDSFVFV